MATLSFNGKINELTIPDFLCDSEVKGYKFRNGKTIMKYLSLLILTICSLHLSAATPINPDSAFVDTVTEWHVNDNVWYEERIDVATIKCIKEYCKERITAIYKAIDELNATYSKYNSLVKTHKYYFTHNEEISEAMYNLNCNIPEYISSKNFLPSLKSSYLYVKNYSETTKTQRFKKEAMNIITISGFLSDGIDGCLSPVKYILQYFNENYVE